MNPYVYTTAYRQYSQFTVKHKISERACIGESTSLYERIDWVLYQNKHTVFVATAFADR